MQATRDNHTSAFRAAVRAGGEQPWEVQRDFLGFRALGFGVNGLGFRV